MAIDDVISNFDTDVSNGARLSLQPASGDEWLLTHVGVAIAGAWQMTSHTNTDEWHAGTVTTQTGLTNDIAQTGFFRQYRLFLTNGEYVRVKNATGGTASMGYSAIKTKD